MHSIKKDLQIQIFYQITIHKILHNTCISNQDNKDLSIKEELCRKRFTSYRLCHRRRRRRRRRSRPKPNL